MDDPFREHAGERRVVISGRIRVNIDIVEIFGASIEENLPQRRERKRRRRYIHKSQFPGRSGKLIRVNPGSESEKRLVFLGNRRSNPNRRRRSVGDISRVEREDG